MALQRHVFDRLAADLAARLSTRAAAAAIDSWAGVEPALAEWAPAEATTVPADRDAARRQLAALIRLARTERGAADAAFLMLVPSLRVVAAELTAAWRADPEETDQAVATAGWEQLTGLAGATVLWPEWAVCGPARDRVRGQFRTAARHRHTSLETLAADGAAAPGAGEAGAGVEAVDLLARAVASGRLSRAGAELVWQVRACGVPAAVVARRSGRQPAAVRMQLARAEAALRVTAGLPAARASLRLVARSGQGA